MTTVSIVVAVAPKGKSSGDGVVFSYPSPGKYVDASGNIDIPKGMGQVALVFELATSTIEWSDGPNVGKFGLSFASGPSGGNALWIWQGSQKSSQKIPDFSTPTTSGPATLTVIDDNKTALDYSYCLSVAVNVPGMLTFQSDPRIRNGGSNRPLRIVLVVAGLVLLAIVVAAWFFSTSARG